MDAKQIKGFQRRLVNEHEKLIKAIGRSRSADNEIGVQKTEDEGDLATISQEKDILYSLHESDVTRLRFIQEALNALDRGDYGWCRRCEEEIGHKRLTAVPWAMTCIQCQEAKEAEGPSARLAQSGMQSAENDS